MRRRKLLVGFGLASVGTPLLSGASRATEAEDDMVEYLFVQTAERALLADGMLTLGGIGATTLYFSDRPDRITGHVPTDRFVGKESEVYETFTAEPPNATLALVTEGGAQELVVVVLKEPRLNGRDLVFPVEILEGPTNVEGGPASLFIDMVGRPRSPMSVAGVHRRRRRRVIHKALD